MVIIVAPSFPFPFTTVLPTTIPITITATITISGTCLSRTRLANSSLYDAAPTPSPIIVMAPLMGPNGAIKADNDRDTTAPTDNCMVADSRRPRLPFRRTLTLP